MTSQDAVSRVRAGDTEAFAEIVERFQSPIVRYLYRMTGDDELARDLAQDTFIQAFKGLPRTTPDLPLKTWIYRIATNNALQHRRRKRLIPFLHFSADADSKEDLLQTGSDTETDKLAVQESLLKVPEKLRVCMVLHFVDGFKYREIAEMLGISEDAVRMRVARGSDEFRRVYGIAGGDER